MTAATVRRGRPRLPGPIARVFGGIGAVGVKELRGRMRGRRAFVVLTIYLVLLGAFAWMVELFLERSFALSFGGFTYASAEIGRGIFGALLMFETLLVVLLAPAFTAGAISLEREKQTLDLLTVTPISSLAIVIGKLFSALTYVFLLIAASVPLTALVFVFGGVAPDDVVRGYLVLFVTALGFGTVGLACSALIKRTQAATIITYAVVLAVTLGATFVWIFWAAMNATNFTAQPAVRDANGVVVQRTPAPEQLLWLNPFIAQVDVLCGTESTYGATCAITAEITGRTLFGGGVVQDVNTKGGGIAPVPADGAATPEPMPVGPGGDVGNGGVVFLGKPTVAAGAIVQPDVRVAIRQDVRLALNDVAIDQQQPFGTLRDAFWPQYTVAWLVVSLVLVLLSVQLVSPTRRWRLRRSRRPAPPAEVTA